MMGNKLLLIPFLILFTIGVLFLQTKNVFATEASPETSISAENQQSVTIKLFWGEGCPHCKAAESFLDSLLQKYSDIHIEKYEIYFNKSNQILMENEAKGLGVDIKGVPFIVIENEYITGYQSDNTTGQRLISLIEKYQKDQLPIEKDEGESKGNQSKDIPDSISLPIIGEMKTSSLSLPIFTVIVAAIDGFNPCAMWVLLFLISLLIPMQSPKKRWLLGSVFILTSGISYFIF
jgi:glutaredoxin